MNEKQLTLQDLTMEDIYRYLYCVNHRFEETVYESQIDELFSKKPYVITNISKTELTYRMDHQYYTIPMKPLDIHTISLLTLLTKTEVLTMEIMDQLKTMYWNYVPLLQLQMDLEPVLKHESFYAPFQFANDYVEQNPMTVFVKEVKAFQGTQKKGKYYDDKWDDLTYQEKMETYQYMSKELFQDQPEIRIPKQGPVQEIQSHLYQLQQLLPSMTGSQTYLLRKLCFPYEEETVAFALYRYMNESHDFVEESVIADYLWYFASHDEKYKYMVQHMELSLVFNALWVLTKNTNVEDGFELLQSLATHKDDIYPFLKHVVPYKFLPLDDKRADVQEDFDFDDITPSDIEKLFEESLSEEKNYDNTSDKEHPTNK